MRKWIVLLICVALLAELYWLYQYAQRPEIETQAQLPSNHPMQRFQKLHANDKNSGNAALDKLPKGPGEIRGILREPTGEPARDVVVALTPISNPYNEQVKEAPPAWSVKSDARGDFIVSSLPTGTYLFSAVRDKHHIFDQLTLSEESPLLEVRPILKPSYSVRGRIVDDRGKDIEGVRITLIPDLGDQSRKLTVEEKRSLESYIYLPAIHSNSKGEFVLEHLAESPWRLLLRAKGFANALSETFLPPAKSVSFVMKEGSSLTLALKKQGGSETVAGMQVELLEKDYGIEKYKRETDQAGMVQFDNLRSATWKVTLPNSEYVMPEELREITILENATPVSHTANLQQGGGIQGRVVTGVRSNGVADIMVNATPINSPEKYQAQTDADGGYAFKGLPSGTYQVLVQLPEQFYMENKDPLEAHIDNADVADVPDIEIAKGVSVQGTVWDARENKAKNALVTLEFTGQSTAKLETKTDSNGRFIFKGLNDNQKITLVASQSGMLSEKYGPKSVSSGGAANIKLQLSLPNRGYISGSVVNAQGRAMQNVPVVCTPDSDLKLEPRKSNTDKFGEFRFNDLVPGNYTITAGRSPEAMATHLAEKIQMPPNGAIKNIQLLLP